MLGAHRKFLPLVVTFVFERAHTVHLHEAFAGNAVLSPCGCEDELLKRLESHPVDMLISALAHPNGKSTLPLVRALHERLPHIPMAAYAELSPQHMTHVLSAGQCGIRTVLIHGVRYSAHDIGALLKDAQIHTLLGYLEPLLSQMRSEYVRRFVQHCLTHAAEPMTVNNVAYAIGATRQHVAREFRSSGLRDPHWFLRASRVLLAAKLLSVQGQSVDRVARVLRFRTGSALRQALQRYTGMTATELRESAGFAIALGHMRAALQPLATPPVEAGQRHASTDVPFVDLRVPFVNGGRVAAAV